MIQRFLLAAVSCLLVELAASAAAGLFAPGTEPLLMIGCALGLLLAAIWYGRASGLAAASILLTFGWAALAAHLWTAGKGDTTAMLFVHQTPVQPVDGTAMFVLATLCTGLAALSGWMLFHAREPWPVAALLGSCLLLRADVTLDFAQRFPFFAFGILCLVAISLAGRARIGGRLMMASVTAALAVVIAWQLPASIPAWSQSFVDPVRGLAVHTVPVAGQKTLDLTRGFKPHQHEVMSITLDGRAANPYWWDGVYDRYDGQSWQITGDQTRIVRAGASILPPTQTGPQATVVAHVRMAETTPALAFPGSPVSADRATIVMSQRSDSGPEQVLTGRALTPGSRYVTSGVVIAPQSGSATLAPAPSSVYLQLPSMPPRVQSLALKIGGRGSELERALRIRDYLALSGRFGYSTTAASQPGHDAVDYFLFESRQGYCNQFATTMAVMLREQGIPSRLVTGFVTGAYQNGQYVVREKDAHSWVEAYLPDRGWVDFEPTPGFALDPQMTLQDPGQQATQPQPASQPVPPRPVTAPTAAPIARAPVATSARARAGAGPSWLWLPAGLLLLAVLLVGILRRPRSARAVYARMARSALVSGRPRPGETPIEFTERAFRRPAARAQARIITDLYVKERYGGQSEPASARIARRAWRSLRLHQVAPWIRS